MSWSLIIAFKSLCFFGFDLITHVQSICSRILCDLGHVMLDDVSNRVIEI